MERCMSGKKRGIHLRSCYITNSEAWRGEYGMGVYGLEWCGDAYRGWREDGRWQVLSDFEWWNNGKLWEIGNGGGWMIFSAGQWPKHTSQKATQWFEDNNIEVLLWLAQSPDLNLIEHLWEHIKQQLCKYKTSPKGAHDLWKRLVDEWNVIPPEVCQNLIESMPRCIQAVIKARGGHTKY